MKTLPSILIASLSLAPACWSAITLTADSGSFDFKYEMDVNPSGQNLDGAGSATDWFNGTVSGVTSPLTYSGGQAFSNNAAGQELFRTDFTGSLTRQNFTDSTAMTIEMRVGKVGATQGTEGWFGAAMQMPGANHSIAVIIADDRVKVREVGGGYVSYLVGSDFTTGSHTLRIAKESGNAWYVWMNGVLLNSNLSTPIVDGNGSFNSSGAWFLGDYGGVIDGDWSVDYVRVEKDGAFAPVPEPAASLLGSIGMLLVLRRRR